jgi:hypothetical protein
MIIEIDQGTVKYQSTMALPSQNVNLHVLPSALSLNLILLNLWKLVTLYPFRIASLLEIDSTRRIN